MKMRFLLIFCVCIIPCQSWACSVLYYIDQVTGQVYVVNHEDYWYDVKAVLWVEPSSEDQWARLWYGWDRFAQGGVNEAGLFFDVAVTPEQEAIPGYHHPESNLGDELLAHCSTVDEAIAYLERHKIALTQSHFMFGDKHGQAAIVEWVHGEKKIHWISDGHLVMTNFLLSDTTQGNYPCYRYESIHKRIDALEQEGGEANLQRVGNLMGQAAQPPRADDQGRTGGTLYTTFINLTTMKFALSYQLSNENVTILDLSAEFAKPKRQKFKLAK
ncbi:penicillin acylase [Reichenbachiella sp. 5M10]|uniref:carcinine hydrolase/isopenicillin-N N-acyltransferase family protein n=1 Tax=Reichenbachiella sp. 5M10 TaxID=1889772 RepID=UPI000C3BC34D|nr:carcinine hydrolase/isopenicillin-N N-acyltransferase family protein [Reichenbachiella sp. 5M10]PIB37463.1 penicillin acylase [Reichenbachiella sp. 5M10]